MNCTKLNITRMTTSTSSEALNIVDKINYREDFQLINVQYFLEITKPFLNINKKCFQCLLCMTDRSTDKINYTVEALGYKEPSTKISGVYLQKQPRK